jgi:hypothetical protein
VAWRMWCNELFFGLVLLVLGVLEYLVFWGICRAYAWRSCYILALLMALLTNCAGVSSSIHWRERLSASAWESPAVLTN